ncbi:PAS domain-containing protein [Desulfobulbus rhabdoformis]|uniref:two-component system sensor histidine kinase NtrB n=1 Tax=Desulfobulbus rhabdoformis TaxID=34032 RepID=UPI0019626D7E|nr:ATP-binding protein [Desulfobulbus rhabdoformis]MBM9614026.1 PAS domain-containing protein [Desulfobulbus rhabdoformis]
MALKRPSFIFSSPWLLAAAGGLLIMIVVTFAFHNLRLEERLMTNAMLQKASTLIRVLHSGARASYIADLRKDYWNNESWAVHVQRVIDHLAEDPDLRFFMVVDKDGRIIAHDNHAKVGQVAKLPELEIAGNTDQGPPKLIYTIQQFKELGRVFETIRALNLVLPSVLPLPIAPLAQQGPLFFQSPAPTKHSLFRLVPDGSQKNNPHYVVIGLDMQEFDRTLRRLQMQIFMLSLAMLFVGLGGWFSLSTVQGFRISQKTLDTIQAFTSLLITKLPVGVIATNEHGYITTWNHAISRLTGIERHKATGRRPGDVLPHQLSSFFDGEPALSSEDEQGNQKGVQIRFGERRCALLCHPLTIVNSQGQYMGRVLLISDVTEIRSLEQRMRENERLAAVGRMAGGVAHEVRNPLSSIKGLALLLKNKFPVGSQEQATAELLIQETERMNRTITEMLSFTRPSVLNLERIDLAALVETNVTLIRTEATENQIALRLELAPDLKPITGDSDRLQQVLMNVFINAMQAMEEGGELAISLNNQEEAGLVELKIHDTGPGIEPELLSQVFYPYFTTKQAGTGLGLAISQKIIADHGGSIEMESESGSGTTVIIQLPFWKGEES